MPCIWPYSIGVKSFWTDAYVCEQLLWLHRKNLSARLPTEWPGRITISGQDHWNHWDHIHNRWTYLPNVWRWWSTLWKKEMDSLLRERDNNPLPSRHLRIWSASLRGWDSEPDAGSTHIVRFHLQFEVVCKDLNHPFLKQDRQVQGEATG